MTDSIAHALEILDQEIADVELLQLEVDGLDARLAHLRDLVRS